LIVSGYSTIKKYDAISNWDARSKGLEGDMLNELRMMLGKKRVRKLIVGEFVSPRVDELMSWCEFVSL
jgi:hypothetical protein